MTDERHGTPVTDERLPRTGGIVGPGSLPLVGEDGPPPLVIPQARDDRERQVPLESARAAFQMNPWILCGAPRTKPAPVDLSWVTTEPVEGKSHWSYPALFAAIFLVWSVLMVTLGGVMF